MARRRRRKSAFPRIRFKRKFPFVQLGSSASVHARAAEYHLRSMSNAIQSGLSALKQGECSRAFHQLIAASRYDGMYQAHADTSPASHHARVHRKSLPTEVIEFEVAFKRACPIGQRATMHGARRRR